MNTKQYRSYLAPTQSIGWKALLVLSLACGESRGQTASDYSANPPFNNANGNIAIGSGSAVAAVDPSGTGALYQAFYYPSYTDEDTGSTISWGGVLQGIFLDDSGRFREDNGIKGKLEDTDIDYVVDIFSDENVTPVRTRLQRFQQAGTEREAVLEPVGAARSCL